MAAESHSGAAGTAAPSSGNERIAVIGAGLMGHGIAQVFLAAGHEVSLQDVNVDCLERSPQNIRSNLALLAEGGLVDAANIEPALSRLTTTADLDEAIAGANFVIECVFEDLPLKQALFAELDRICPPATVLATNTSVMSVTEIGALTVHKERVVGTHFWNPPYLIPLVEVVRTEQVAEEVVDRTMALLRAAGKRPIDVKKDVPGFVANRLQHALWREAISIVERGIADAATVDESIRYGFGLRLPVLGPLENADMVGLDLTLAIHEYLLPHLEASPEPSPLLREKAERGELGFKSLRGFQDWDAEAMESSRRRLVAHLVEITRSLSSRPPRPA
jgi:3-hydroxybutyryl-CoA dehydrogenase